MKLFKPEDFEYIWGQSTTGAEDYGHPIAEIANKKLQEWLEQQPVVYAEKKEGFQPWHNVEFVGATHRARICMIEPLVQEHECEPVWYIKEVWLSDGLVSPSYFGNCKCRICGAELVAKWGRVK